MRADRVGGRPVATRSLFTGVAVGLLLAALSVVPTLNAQTTVRGILYDSLRLSGIAGARVQVLGAELAPSTTDEHGVFRLLEVTPGPQTLRFTHPRLDSLGIETLDLQIDIDSAAREMNVFASTPGLGTVLGMLCGELPDGSNRLVVRLEDRTGRPVPAADVRIAWIETGMARRQMTNRDKHSDATTNSDGMALVCTVPTPGSVSEAAGVVWRVSPLRVSVAGDGLVAGPVVLERTGSGTIILELVAGTSAEPITIVGRATQRDGTPLAGASVRVDGTTQRVSADSAGVFALPGVSAYSQDLVVTAIGFRPQRLILAPGSDGVLELGTIELDSVVTLLDAVSVVATAELGAGARFAERRRVLQGTFLDSTELARMPMITPGFLSGRVPRSMVVSEPDGRKAFVFRRVGMGLEVICVPRLFVDGQDQGPLEIGQLDHVLQYAKRIEVYRANFAPPEFTDFAGCGAVVIWTK